MFYTENCVLFFLVMYCLFWFQYSTRNKNFMNKWQLPCKSGRLWKSKNALIGIERVPYFNNVLWYDIRFEYRKSAVLLCPDLLIYSKNVVADAWNIGAFRKPGALIIAIVCFKRFNNSHTCSTSNEGILLLPHTFPNPQGRQRAWSSQTWKKRNWESIF